MLQKRYIYITATIIALVLGCSGAHADTIYYSSEYSINDLGTVNKELSDLCSRMKFNQTQPGPQIHFAKENIILQGSKLNKINDPYQYGDETMSYWFIYDGHSDCVVHEVPNE